MSANTAAKVKIFSEPERTKEKIFNAAVDLFSVKGFRGTTIRDIADAVGMNTANLYHYFGNKEKLLLFILDKVNKNVLARLVKTLEEVEKKDPLERLKALLMSHIVWSTEYIKESKIFFLPYEELSDEGIITMKKFHGEVFNIYLNVLIDVENNGYVKNKNIKMLGIFSEGVLRSYLLYQKELNEMPPEKIANEIIDYIVGGILYKSEQ